MKYIKLEHNENLREQVNLILTEEWGNVKIVVHGEWFDLSKSKAFVCIEENKIVGIITYCYKDNKCEITSLVSLKEHCGIGQKLMSLVVDECRLSDMKKIFLVTTNDCIRAYKFYQQFGMELEEVRLNQLDVSRKMKPEIPSIGEDNIPLKHELQFCIVL